MATSKAISLWQFCVISYSYLPYPYCLTLWTSFRGFFANQLVRHQIVSQSKCAKLKRIFLIFSKTRQSSKKFFLLCDQKIKCNFLMSYLARLHACTLPLRPGYLQNYYFAIKFFKHFHWRNYMLIWGIGVARIFDGGGPNHKSHAMTSSEIFKKGTFCRAKIS